MYDSEIVSSLLIDFSSSRLYKHPVITSKKKEKTDKCTHINSKSVIEINKKTTDFIWRNFIKLSIS